ncbi:YlxM family DNA-binding protein [Selenomonas sp. KH1T6]|uniref:YlxM family DNA-binding protein n=1 Tax=Selenomonas sp. KH1T6 TaxID=3158784 RepID=UPI000A73F7B8
MTGEDMLEQLLYLSTLFDLYGPLLTEKQQECLRLHLFEDFSLAEIGESLGISRQAVYDNIHRAQKAMESYEEKLELARRYHLERQELTELAGKIERLRQPGNEAAVDDILGRLTPLLGRTSQEA